MATTLYEGRGIVLSRHAGPPAVGEDSRRWQITTWPEGYAELDYEGWCAFAGAVMLEFAMMRTPQFLTMLDQARRNDVGDQEQEEHEQPADPTGIDCHERYEGTDEPPQEEV